MLSSQFCTISQGVSYPWLKIDYIGPIPHGRKHRLVLSGVDLASLSIVPAPLAKDSQNVWFTNMGIHIT